MKKILIVLLLLIIIMISGCKKEIVDKATADCIASKAEIYVLTGCTACAKQKEMFGENFQYLNAIDCKINPEECSDKNILKVPTWIINENKLEGVQSIETLKRLTGC